MGKKAKDDALPFEDALGQLEKLVDRLEGGDLDLEKSLEEFEAGVKLVRHCSERLKSAELRIRQLEATALGTDEHDLALEDDG